MGYISDEWYMFDDDNVSCVTAEDVLKLSGGGKSCIYINQTNTCTTDTSLTEKWSYITVHHWQLFHKL